MQTRMDRSGKFSHDSEKNAFDSSKVLPPDIIHGINATIYLDYLSCSEAEWILCTKILLLQYKPYKRDYHYPCLRNEMMDSTEWIASERMKKGACIDCCTLHV